MFPIEQSILLLEATLNAYLGDDVAYNLLVNKMLIKYPKFKECFKKDDKGYLKLSLSNTDLDYNDIPDVFYPQGQRRILLLLVSGGASKHNQFIKAKLGSEYSKIAGRDLTNTSYIFKLYNSNKLFPKLAELLIQFLHEEIRQVQTKF